MKAKTKFTKMFYKLPDKAKKELVYNFSDWCLSLNVCVVEIRNDTRRGKQILKDLGYEDD